MHKINQTSLIISIAAALVIFGLAIMIGLRYDWTFGLLTGAGAFIILIAVMLIYNVKQNR